MLVHPALKLTSASGKFYVEFYRRRRDRLFCYRGFSEYRFDPTEELEAVRKNPDYADFEEDLKEVSAGLEARRGEPYWECSADSGLFKHLAEAQREAVSQIWWLRHEHPELGQNVPAGFWERLRGFFGY